MDTLQDYAWKAFNLYSQAGNPTSPPPPPSPTFPASMSNITSYLQTTIPLLTPLLNPSTYTPYLSPLLPYLQTLASTLQTQLASSPILVSFFTLLLFLFTLLKIVSIARRIVFWIVGLAIKMAIFGIVGLIGMVVWQRGVGECVDWCVDIGKFWMGEYQRFEGFGRGGVGNGGGGGGWDGGRAHGQGWKR